MLFDKALKDLDGQSVGGQLIVNIDGKNVLVGHYSNGELIEEQSDDAQVLLSIIREDAPKPRGKGKAAAASDAVVEPAAEEPAEAVVEPADDPAK